MVRLVCRQWSALSAPYLIDRVFFAPRRKVLEYFTAVSKHPVFSKTAIEIVYIPKLCVKSTMDSEEHQSACQHCRDNEKVSFDDQEAILESEEDMEVLQAALHSMPNLAKLLICDNLLEYDGRSWYSTDMPLSWADAYALPPMFGLFPQYDSDDSGYGSSWDLLMLENLFCAMSLSGRHFHTLAVEAQCQYNRIILPSTLCQIPSDASWHTSHILRTLSKLSLSFSNSSLGFINEDGNGIRMMSEWLEAATVLEELTLAFLMKLDPEEGACRLLTLPEWPHLRYLKLVGLVCTEDDLVAFLRKHALTAVCLQSICLTGPGTWEELSSKVLFDEVKLSHLANDMPDGYSRILEVDIARLERRMLRSKPVETASKVGYE